MRVARKHVAWYTRHLAGSAQFRQQLNLLERADEQIAAVDRYFEQLGALDRRLTYTEEELAA